MRSVRYTVSGGGDEEAKIVLPVQTGDVAAGEAVMRQPVKRVEETGGNVQEWEAVWHLDPETGEAVYDQPFTEIIETTGIEVEPDEEPR